MASSRASTSATIGPLEEIHYKVSKHLAGFGTKHLPDSCPKTLMCESVGNLVQLLLGGRGGTQPGADQFLSDRRGADFPGGCIGALPKRLLGFRSFKNTLYQ